MTKEQRLIKLYNGSYNKSIVDCRSAKNFIAGYQFPVKENGQLKMPMHYTLNERITMNMAINIRPNKYAKK